jgi:hypothetical protein
LANGRLAEPSVIGKIRSIVGEYHLEVGSFETLKECLTSCGFVVTSFSEDENVGLFVATRFHKETANSQ